MKFFLCSSFITKEIQLDFEKLLGRSSKGLKIACITTALKAYLRSVNKTGSEPEFEWVEYEYNFARNQLGCSLDLFDIAEMSTESQNVFFDYDIIWGFGGLVNPLISEVYRTHFDVTLNKFLKKGVYIGTSAGSMICSKAIDCKNWYIGDPEKSIMGEKGLGYVDFQIYPHYEEKLLDEIKKARHKDQEYWLLKDGQAVIVNNGEVSTCGGEIVKLLPEV